MIARQPRFEVVRTDAGWHARFRAANSRVMWTTECYTRRLAAEYAIYQFGKSMWRSSTPWPLAVQTWRHGAVEVRTIDDRGER